MSGRDSRRPPPGPPADTAHYDELALDRLNFILGAKRLGLKLREIAELLADRDSGVCPCEPAESLLSRRVADIDAEMARLAGLRVQLTAMLAGIPGPGCPDPLPGSWCPPECEKERR